MSWVEVDGAGWRWMELGGGGWSWVEVGAWFSKTLHFLLQGHHQCASKGFYHTFLINCWTTDCQCPILTVQSFTFLTFCFLNLTVYIISKLHVEFLQ